MARHSMVHRLSVRSFIVRSFITQLAALLLLCLPLTHALAHTPVTGTSPSNGAILKQSPPAIEISFRDSVRLTSMVAVVAGAPERKLEFTPTGSAATFKVVDPQFESGRVEIQWKALSHDGHVIRGSFTFVIEPAVAKTR